MSNKRGSDEPGDAADIKRLAALVSSQSEAPVSVSVSVSPPPPAPVLMIAPESHESKEDVRQLALVASSMAEGSGRQAAELLAELETLRMENGYLVAERDAFNSTNAELTRQLEEAERAGHDLAKALQERRKAEETDEVKRLAQIASTLSERPAGDGARDETIAALKAMVVRLTAVQAGQEDAARVAELLSSLSEMKHVAPSAELARLQQENEQLRLRMDQEHKQAGQFIEGLQGRIRDLEAKNLEAVRRESEHKEGRRSDNDALEMKLAQSEREISELRGKLAEAEHYRVAPIDVSGHNSWDVARLIAGREAIFVDVKQNLPKPFLPLLSAVFAQ